MREAAFTLLVIASVAGCNLILVDARQAKVGVAADVRLASPVERLFGVDRAP